MPSTLSAFTILCLGLAPVAFASDECIYSGGGVALPAWKDTILILLAPTLCMLLGSAVFLCVSTPKAFLASMQKSVSAGTACDSDMLVCSLSAGVLIAAIGNELFPLMKCGAPGASDPPSKLASYIGLSAGMLVGVSFMFGLDVYLDGLRDDEEQDDGEETIGLAPLANQSAKYSSVASADDEQESQATLTDEQEAFTALFGAGTEDLKTTKDFSQHLADLKEQVKDVIQASKQDDRAGVDGTVHELRTRFDAAMMCLTSEKELTQTERKKLQRHAGQFAAALDGLDSTGKGAKSVLRTLDQQLSKLHAHVHTLTKMTTWNNPLVSMPVSDRTEAPDQAQIPWGNVVATTIDGAVDGLLVGLSYSASSTAGVSMAIATCIEMGFLGLSFSAQVKEGTRNSLVHFAICTLPPLALFGAGMLGRGVGSALESSQAVFIGVIAFALVALLYLVSQELLVEAREVSGEAGIWIRVTFFVGVFGGLILDKVLD